jgi:hypothetical protein
MSKRSEDPAGAIHVGTYDELNRFTHAFGEGKLNLLLLVGAPGSGKSRAVQSALGGSACWIDGNATAFGLYKELWFCRDEPIVIDDVDSLYSDRAAVRLLKGLCQTEVQKRIGWHSNAAALKREEIPTQFLTESRVSIICNRWETWNVNVAAVQDRAHLVIFEPSAFEVHARVAEWYWDTEIFQFVGERLHLVEALSMRDYVLAWELKQSRLDWRSRLLERWGLTGRRLLVAKLKADKSYDSEEARVRAFTAMGGGCRATYFNHVRRLQPRVQAPPIVLQNRPRDQPASDTVLDRQRRCNDMGGRNTDRHLDSSGTSTSAAVAERFR